MHDVHSCILNIRHQWASAAVSLARTHTYWSLFLFSVSVFKRIKKITVKSIYHPLDTYTHYFKS